MSNQPRVRTKPSFAKSAQSDATETATIGAEGEGEFPDFGAILAQSSNGERPTACRTFEMKGKRYKFEIYTDGREDAELWARLSAAVMHGYALERSGRLAGKPFEGITESFPVGSGIKQITVKDPAYLGSVKLLTMVLKRPAWGWSECLMMGHELGQAFLEVCNWAAAANGVAEDIIRKMDQLEKNAPSLSR